MKPANPMKSNEFIMNADLLEETLSKSDLLGYFSADDLKRLNEGKLTSIIKNVHYQGKILEGRFLIYIETDGSHTLHFKKCNNEIVIPEKVLGKKLSGKEKNLLAKGEAIGPFLIGKNEMYFHVDREFNTFTMYSPKGIGLPNDFMGYKFSSNDIQLLNSGKSIGPKVFCADGHYFMGSFSIDKNEVLYLFNIQYDKELPKSDALKLVTKYNDSQYNNGIHGLTDLERQAFFVPSIPVVTDKINDTSSCFSDNTPTGYAFKNESYSFYYNQAFEFITFDIAKKIGIPGKLFGNTFSYEELTRLQKGETLHNRILTFVSGDRMNANISLWDYDEMNRGMNRIIIQINSQRKKEQEEYIETLQKFDIQKFSRNDQLIMNLVDKKDVKALNNLAENGIKPSENLNRLIYFNSNIGENDKNRIARIFNNNPDEVRLMNPMTSQNNVKNPEQNPSMNAGKLNNSKIKDAGKFQKNETDHQKRNFAYSIKNLFNDM